MSFKNHTIIFDMIDEPRSGSTTVAVGRTHGKTPNHNPLSIARRYNMKLFKINTTIFDIINEPRSGSTTVAVGATHGKTPNHNPQSITRKYSMNTFRD